MKIVHITIFNNFVSRMYYTLHLLNFTNFFKWFKI
jgi:hypothetical protein